MSQGCKAPLGRFIPARGQTATVFHHWANRGPRSLELYFYQIFICLVYGLLKTWAHQLLPATRLPGCANAHLPLSAHSPPCGRMSPHLSPQRERPQALPRVYSFNRPTLIGSHNSGRKLLFPKSRGICSICYPYPAPHPRCWMFIPVPFSEGLS